MTSDRRAGLRGILLAHVQHEGVGPAAAANGDIDTGRNCAGLRRRLDGGNEIGGERVIAGAKVTITNPATGFDRIVTTDGSGSFTIPLLQPGTYTLLFEREGFTRVQVPK